MTSKTKMQVPLLDLQAQYEPYKELIKDKILATFDSKYFINGPEVTLLEDKISSYCGTKYAVGVSSGSDALIASMMALDIGPGDEVITTPFSFFATAGSIARVGATPVFCDIDLDTFNIDPTQIEALITKKTKAIVPVHLFGQCCDMDTIMDIANAHHLHVIEDAAQALGAAYTTKNGVTKKAGNFGTAGCFSFFPSKNLGACGDAGVITTNNSELYEKLKCIRMHGETSRYHHKFIGGNFRIDAIQAGILSIKLDYLDQQHQGRQANANFYNQHINANVKIPSISSACTSIYNQYTLTTPNRESLKQFLTDHTIGNNIYYPIPLHLQECFNYLGYKVGDFPQSEKAAHHVCSIPIFSELTEEQLNYIVSIINEFNN